MRRVHLYRGKEDGGVEDKGDSVLITLLNIQYLYNLSPFTLPTASLVYAYKQWVLTHTCIFNERQCSNQIKEC